MDTFTTQLQIATTDEEKAFQVLAAKILLQDWRKIILLLSIICTGLRQSFFTTDEPPICQDFTSDVRLNTYFKLLSVIQVLNKFIRDGE